MKIYVDDLYPHGVKFANKNEVLLQYNFVQIATRPESFHHGGTSEQSNVQSCSLCQLCSWRTNKLS